MKKEEAKKIVTDPLGSYTGRPVDGDDKPIQDADDLQSNSKSKVTEGGL